MWAGRHHPAYILGGLAYFGSCILVAWIFFMVSERKGGSRERAVRSAAVGLVLLHIVLTPYAVLILAL